MGKRRQPAGEEKARCLGGNTAPSRRLRLTALATPPTFVEVVWKLHWHPHPQAARLRRPATQESELVVGS